MSRDCAYQSVITLICDLEGAEALIRSPWEGYSPVRLRTCTEMSCCSYLSFSFISSSVFSLLISTEKALRVLWGFCCSPKKITFASFF